MRHIPEKTHVIDELPSALVCEVFGLEFSIDEATSPCIQKRKQRLASLPGDGGEGASFWRAVLCLIQIGEDGKGKEGQSRKQDFETESKCILS